MASAIDIMQTSVISEQKQSLLDVKEVLDITSSLKQSSKQQQQETTTTTFSSNKTVSGVKSRLEEKEELSDLNDRLAAYIDRMRSLESQNAKLSLEINQATDSCNRKLEGSKLIYEAELAESRRLLDDIAKEQAELKLENNKLNGIVVDLRPKLDQEEVANKSAQNRLSVIERSLVEKDNLIALYTSERLELQNRERELDLLAKDLEVKLDAEKERLEKEIITRVDCENRLLTMKEESSFLSHLEGDKFGKVREEVYFEFQKQLAEKDEKYSILLERCTKLQAEVKSLSEYKCSLDKELREYDTLLQEEEVRLSINQQIETAKEVVVESAASSIEIEQVVSRKRKLEEEIEVAVASTSVENTATGPLSISDVDAEGKSVTIINNGTEDVSLEGLLVQRISGDDKNSFTFPAESVLKPEESSTIWSESEGKETNAPTDFVLTGSWVTGGSCVETTVTDANSEVIAKHTITSSTNTSSKCPKLSEEQKTVARTRSCILL